MYYSLSRLDHSSASFISQGLFAYFVCAHYLVCLGPSSQYFNIAFLRVIWWTCALSSSVPVIPLISFPFCLLRYDLTAASLSATVVVVLHPALARRLPCIDPLKTVSVHSLAACVVLIVESTSFWCGCYVVLASEFGGLMHSSSRCPRTILLLLCHTVSVPLLTM